MVFLLRMTERNMASLLLTAEKRKEKQNDGQADNKFMSIQSLVPSTNISN
jgi:hypothetical protein